MSAILRPIRWLYNEFGVASVYHTGRDAWLVITNRTCRMFAYGANSLIIALFFSSLNFTDTQIGLFFTLTLVGDVLLSLLLTLIADRVGRRKILLLGSAMMIISGVVFAIFENFWILLFAAVVGVISATGGDFGPFRAIEESTLSHLTTPKTRSDVLSWYVVITGLGSAAGTEFSGRAVEYLRQRDGWTVTNAYHAMFWLYVIMGALNAIGVLLLSAKCEAPSEKSEREPADAETSERLLDEHRQKVDDEDVEENGEDATTKSKMLPEPPKQQKQSRFAQISSETRSIMWKLWFLLTVDSLADGMVSMSLTYYYIDRKFTISKSLLGDLASTSYILGSSSAVFAGPLARRLGLVNTMVFTHLPSSAAVLFFPLPQGLPLTIVLFFLRTGLNNMDQAPRTAFIAAVVKPEERTAVMGITSMLRTLASTVGPSITGALADTNRFWIAFVVAGVLRIVYDLGLFAMFVNLKLYAHETAEPAADSRRLSDDEEAPVVVEMQPIESGAEQLHS